MVCFGDEKVSACSYRSKIETVRVQASPSRSYCAVKELDCKVFHKLALKASMNRLKYH